MDHHLVGEPQGLPVSVILFAFTAVVYLRARFRLRSTSANLIPAWRAGGFLAGLIVIWFAVSSPIAELDHEFLTVHMIQHLLLMTVAAPLILLGEPVMLLFQGLALQFLRRVIDALRLWPFVRQPGKSFSHPAFCWLAGTVTLMGWHIPAVFTLGLQSQGWHIVEQGSFLAAGLLFWWPVVQPRQSVSTEPGWSMVVYLFLATLPCDVLSAFLVFSDRVVYTVYLSTPRQTGFSVLADQQCAGALMWTCVTVVYLVAGTVFVTRLLLPHANPRRLEAL